MRQAVSTCQLPCLRECWRCAEQAQSGNGAGSSGFGNINPSLYALASQPLLNTVLSISATEIPEGAPVTITAHEVTEEFGRQLDSKLG
jgi:hypothetical protein